MQRWSGKWRPAAALPRLLPSLVAGLLAGCSGAALEVSVSPSLLALAPGARTSFLVSVEGGSDVSVTWSVDEAGGGAVDALGTYTAPGAAGAYHVRATSKADPRASASATVSVVVPEAEIRAFSADPPAIPLGWSTKLSWLTLNAAQASLDNGAGDVGPFGSLVLRPLATTTYTLTARRGEKSATRTTTVTVGPPQPPAIPAFAAGPASILTGEQARLAWTVQGADALSLDQGLGAVTGDGLVVGPLATTVYSLTAANSQGTSSATATVTVRPPEIRAFAGVPGFIHPGEQIALTWTAAGATRLSIDQGVGDVTGSDHVTVAPGFTTTYTLTASAASGTSTAQASVIFTTVPAPVIAGFSAMPAAVLTGGSSLLAWSVDGASTVSLDQGLGGVTGVSQLKVSPRASTAYQLTAAGPGGVTTASASVEVAVVAPPVIAAFSAAPSTLAVGQATSLSCEVGGATSLRIDQGVGVVSCQTLAGLQFKPAGSTVYTLTATGPGGTATAKVPVSVLPAGKGLPVVATAAAAITAGQGTTLYWTAPGALSYSVDHGVGVVKGTSVNVKPTQSTTYLLTITYPTGALSLPVTVSVHPAAPPPWIASFSADAPVLAPGGAATLSWTTSNAAQVSIDPAPGAVGPGGSASVSPSATTVYTLTAAQGSLTATAQVTVVVDPAAQLPPADPGTASVTVSVDTRAGVHPISPLIYGINAPFPGADLTLVPATLLRLGGNRWAAYNWETNASSGGIESSFASDGYLGGGTSPAGALLQTLVHCQDRSGAASGCATMITLPLQGWVAGDKAGPVAAGTPQLARFHASSPRLGTTPGAGPDTTDRVVYQDEFAGALLKLFPGARRDPLRPLLIELGNEPDLYSFVHHEIQSDPLTYAALFDQVVTGAVSLKDAQPGTLLFAPSNYGWHGFHNLQEASDANGRVFLDAFLALMMAESAADGRRLLDALDLHWYPELYVGAQRISELGAARNSAEVAALRVQAPRSLWDPGYVESSWITESGTSGGQGQTGGQPLRFIPWVNEKIAANFPGTGLAITEYRFGGGDHISGAVANADALGVFGREGVLQASYFPLEPSEPYIGGAFRAFRDYDGGGGRFGDTSVSATSSDSAHVTAYASLDAGRPERVVVVLINRDTAARTVRLLVNHTAALSRLSAFRIAEPVLLSRGAVVPRALPAAALTANAARLTLPAMSVTTLALTP